MLIGQAGGHELDVETADHTLLWLSMPPSPRRPQLDPNHTRSGDRTPCKRNVPRIPASLGPSPISIPRFSSERRGVKLIRSIKEVSLTGPTSTQLLGGFHPSHNLHRCRGWYPCNTMLNPRPRSRLLQQFRLPEQFSSSAPGNRLLE